MAAKNLNECAERIFCVGPLDEIKTRFMNELRDFFAHEVMKMGENATAQDLFERVFKDVPAFGKPKTPNERLEYLKSKISEKFFLGYNEGKYFEKLPEAQKNWVLQEAQRRFGMKWSEAITDIPSFVFQFCEKNKLMKFYADMDACLLAIVQKFHPDTTFKK